MKEIASKLGLSLNGVRQHLAILEKEQLVHRGEKRGITGRPAIVYHLNEKGLDTFPKIYDDFCCILLEIIEKEYGTELLTNLLDKFGEVFTAKVKSDINAETDKNFMKCTLRDKLQIIVKIFAKYGKYTFLEETEESFALKNYNCLLYRISKANPLVCNIDEIVIGDLIGQDVEKEQCIRDGDNLCLYRIKKLKSEFNT